MSRFKVGQTVYDGRGDKTRELVVARVIDNHLIPVFQYSFEAPYDGFACGEQSIRATREGRDLKIGECFKPDDKEVECRIHTLASATYSTIEENTGDVVVPKMACFDSTRVDFKPSLEMCEWLTDYADGRLIIHVGSGQGHLVKMLKMAKARAIGIEPNFNKRLWIEWRMVRSNGRPLEINEILEGTVEKYKGLIEKLGKDNKALLIFARPKVYDFVYTGLANMPKGMEALYIDTEFPSQLNDFVMQTEVLEHEGVSEDNEVVISIKK